MAVSELPRGSSVPCPNVIADSELHLPSSIHLINVSQHLHFLSVHFWVTSEFLGANLQGLSQASKEYISLYISIGFLPLCQEVKATPQLFLPSA